MQTWHGRGVTLLPPEAMDRKVMMMGPSPKGVLSEGGGHIISLSLSRGAEARSNVSGDTVVVGSSMGSNGGCWPRRYSRVRTVGAVAGTDVSVSA